MVCVRKDGFSVLKMSRPPQEIISLKWTPCTKVGVQYLGPIGQQIPVH